MTQQVTAYRFKSSGVEIGITPISTFLMQAAQRTIPPPQPPLEKVQNADGTWRDEPNYDHPDYANALALHRVEIERVVRRLVIRQAVVYRLTDEDHARIKQVREDFVAITGAELSDSDMEVFISYIAVVNMSDYQDFVQTVLGVSQPTDPKSPNGTTSSMSGIVASESANTHSPEAG